MKFKLLMVFILLFGAVGCFYTTKSAIKLEERMDLLEDWMFFFENDMLSEDAELIPLSEWDSMRYKEYSYPKLNGIACPNCSEELLDIDGYEGFSVGGAPRIRIMCEECGYMGTRVK